MKLKKYGIAGLMLILLLWSCGPVYPDNSGSGPEYPIPEFSLSYINYNEMHRELHCRIQVLYDLPVEQVIADLELQGFVESAISVTLNDSAAAGDALAGDNIFSRSIPLTRIDSLSGKVYVQYAVQEAGSLVQTFLDTLELAANLPPLITDIIMPDTLVRPESGSKELLLAVHADDPNGQEDVIAAYFQVKNNITGAWGETYDCYDNGTNGDTHAGDGIFSRGLQISSENTAATNYFRFRVKDNAANFSAWYPDSVVVQ